MRTKEEPREYCAIYQTEDGVDFITFMAAEINENIIQKVVDDIRMSCRKRVLALNIVDMIDKQC